jgi:mannose-1-phosphate guanylyltransferase
MKLVIMAGGGGTRLWPVSRKNSPKQTLPFVGDQTLLQATFDRLSKSFAIGDIFVSTNVNQCEIVLEQLPAIKRENLILEPEKKDTAAAIGYAAIKLIQIDPEACFVTINSDAYIKNEKEYLRILKLAEKVIEKYPQKAVMVGVKPTYPETGYGYIKMAEQIDKFSNESGGFDQLFRVEKFVEKPDYETAKQYVDDWEYLWNPALFVWKAKSLLEKFKEFLPRHYEILMALKDNLNQANYIKEKFTEFEPVSIDYAIMEKLLDMVVIPADFGWSDIGHWRTIKDVLSRPDKDLIKGKVITLNNSGNLIYNYTDKLVATIGLKDLIIVQTEDVTLICHKDQAQEVKKILAIVKEKNYEEYL